MTTLNVRNRRQAVLFNTELRGQISDGMWENTRPERHWHCWCDTNVVVNPDNVGRDFFAEKDNYQLNSKKLLDVVGERMMRAVRLDQAFGEEATEAFERLWGLCDDDFRMPEYDGEYWAKVRTTILVHLCAQDVSLEDVRRVGEDATTYDRKALNADLRDLRVIFKTFVS